MLGREIQIFKKKKEERVNNIERESDDREGERERER